MYKKFYYNGVLLPEIPQDVLAEYPYVFICKGSTRYNLVLSNKKYYRATSTSSKPDRLDFSATIKVQNYWLTFEDYENGADWSFRNTEGYYYDTSGLLWSNYNIPNTSATSTTIYFYGSEPSTTTAWQCFETTGGTSLTGTLDVEEGMWILATVTTRSETTYPSDWTLLHESTSLNSDNLNQRMSFLCKKAESSGIVSITIAQSASARIYINLIGIKGISGFRYHDGSEYYTDTKYSSYNMIRPSYKKIIWGLSTLTWATSSPYGEWTCDELSGKPISLLADTQRRQANFIDEILSDSRSFKSNNSGSDYAAIIDYVEVILPLPTIYIIKENTLLDIANAIRDKIGKTEQMNLSQMPDYIKTISDLLLNDSESALFGNEENLEKEYSITANRLNEIAIEAKRFARTNDGLNPAQIVQSLKDAIDDNFFIEGCVPEINSKTVTKIKQYCFYDDKSLKRFDASNVTSIENNAFNGCNNLDTVILRSETMCSLSNTNAFTNSSIANGSGYIYVTQALIDTYKSNSIWVTYASQIRAIEDYPDVCDGKEVIREYVLDVFKEAEYVFDKRYVDYNGSYSLITEYECNFVEEKIDSGVITTININTTGLTSIEGLVIE